MDEWKIRSFLKLPHMITFDLLSTNVSRYLPINLRKSVVSGWYMEKYDDEQLLLSNKSLNPETFFIIG